MKINNSLKKNTVTLGTAKQIVIIIFIKALATGNIGRLAGKGSIVKANVQEADLQTVIADQIDQLAGLGRDRLLVEQHEQPVQPLGRDAVCLRTERQQGDLSLG